MSQARFSRSKVLGGLAAAALMLGVGACGGEPEPTHAQSAVTGEEAFKGLFFGEGAVAARLPEVTGSLALSNLPPEEQARHAQRRTQLVASIKDADPTFFERFGADIQSGNHLRIEQALNEGLAVMKTASQGSLSQSDTDSGSLEVMCLILMCHVATWTATSDDQRPTWLSSPLQRDQMAEMIATRLAIE